MKVTNLTNKEESWKIGDYFQADETNSIKRIGYMEGKGYFVYSFTDLISGAIFSTKRFWNTIEQLVENYTEQFGMTRIVIKEVIVESL